jgi:parallel beta-helix repeat protein
MMRRLTIAALFGLLSCGSALAAASVPVAASVVPQDPGPSQALFAAPYYRCVTNYYVAPSGSDATGTGTSAAPWATLNRANGSGKLAAGACVNVSPGSYAGVQLTASGNLASATGYVVWRCTTMDACIVNTTAGINRNAGFISSKAAGSASYVMIDGFTIPGTGATYNVGVEFTGHTNGQVGLFGSHHVWVLNSVIYGNGQGGVAFAESDYTYAIHNKIYGNANAPNCDSSAQGSGLANNVPLDITAGVPGYVATADDKTNPNPLIGSFVVGSSWFHNVYEWNVVFNNYLSHCTTGDHDTDGNNIILDTFGTGNGNSVSYPDQTLIGFNVVYNAGGGGIHIFYSEYATVANNTCYNNGLDPYQGGTAGGAACIDTNASYGNTIINNIAVAVPGAPPAGGCSFKDATLQQRDPRRRAERSAARDVQQQHHAAAGRQQQLLGFLRQEPADRREPDVEWRCVLHHGKQDGDQPDVGQRGRNVHRNPKHAAGRRQLRPAIHQSGHRLRPGGDLSAGNVGGRRSLLSHARDLPLTDLWACD